MLLPGDRLNSHRGRPHTQTTAHRRIGAISHSPSSSSSSSSTANASVPMPSAADWFPIPGKPTPRSLRPAYVIESGRRELSSFSELSGHAHAYSDMQSTMANSSSSYMQHAVLPPPSRRASVLRQPSNRSEAALLAMDLDERLAAAPAPRQYRYEIVAYDAVFDELIEQVSVHCSERGALLSRLKSFYSRSVDATERLGEAARARQQAHTSALEAECASLRAKLARLSAALYKPKADLCKRLYSEMHRQEQRALLVDMVEQLDERARAELLTSLVGGRRRLEQQQAPAAPPAAPPAQLRQSSTLDAAFGSSSDDEDYERENRLS
jgi:IS1 family transposase